MPLYFAYGLLLDLRAFQNLAGNAPARPVAPAKLPAYKLVFRHLIEQDARAFSDLMPDSNGTVYGALFNLTDAQVTALDAPQAPGAQYKRAIAGGMVLQDAQKVKAVLHEAVNKVAAPAEPMGEQVTGILRGALQSGLPLPWAWSLFGSFAQTSSVADIETGKPDGAGELIVRIHVKVPPLYAVYETERVKVQYADDTTLADQQRKAMAELNELRSQITGLIDGWQAKVKPAQTETTKSRCLPHVWPTVMRPDGRAKKYNARMAAGLVMCFEGDVKNARATLQGIYDDITAERESLGRFQYLEGAFFTMLGVVMVFYVFRHFHWPQFYSFPANTAELMLAARAGAVGAFFSVAMGLRGRTIKTDLHTRDNVLDAFLRILIGTIAGTVLVLLLQTDFVGGLTPGDAKITGGMIKDWKSVLLLGFVAGFLERLVPDLLAKSQ
jgi:hypothetical protein